MENYYILIVDDNKEDCFFIKRLLRKSIEFIYTIIEASTGEQALELCETERLDCILLDYMLPNMTGLEVLAQFRASTSEWAQVPIIFMTGQGSEKIAVQAIKGGAHDYIIKSEFTFEKLHTAIANAIQNAKLQIQLRHSEDRYRALVEVTANIVWKTDSKGQADFVTRGWQNLTGQTDEEMADWGWINVIHPDDRDHAARLWAEAVAAKQAYFNEYRVLGRDGKYHDMEVRGIAILNADGSLREWAGTDIDVTSRKEMERALKQVNERFTLATDAFQSVIFDWHIASNRVLRTVGLFGMLGYHPDEVDTHNQWWLDQIHPDDLEVAKMTFNSAFLTSNAYSSQYRVRHKNGSDVYVWEQGIIVRDEAGNATRVIGNTIDITPLKIIQKQLAEREAFIAHIVDNVPALVYLYDVREYRNIYLNLQTHQLLGYPPRYLEDKKSFSVTDLAHPDDVPALWATLDKITHSSSDDVHEVEYRMQHYNGEWRWFLAKETVFLRDEEGNALQILAIAYDITVHKLVNEQKTELLRLEQFARIKAEEATNLKIQFLGMVSHDLRTPLASIKGFTTSLIAEDVTFDDLQRRQFLTIIDQETDNLSELIEQLLEVSHIQSGTFRVNPETIHISEVLTLIENQLKTLTKNHKLVISLPAELPFIMADVRRIGQVLVNLVGNAVKFSPINTRIEIKVSVLDDQLLLIEVCDQGTGIPTEKREAIFGAFSQLNTPQKSKGAGLGLAICKSLVEAHNGKIWIADGITSGTRVCFMLPQSDSMRQDISVYHD